MRILVCDDHAVFRSGLRMIVSDLADEVELIEASDAAQALAIVDENDDLDLVLLDLQMPGMDGRAGLRRLRASHPGIPVVIVSASEEPSVMRETLESGASGYIPKGASGAEMLAALRLVQAGGVYVPRVALSAGPPAGEAGAGQVALSDERRERAERLTPRQVEVLSLMARGLTNREIQDVLAIAEGTVKTHVAAILVALDVTNRTEAAVLARELGLKAPGEE